MMNNSSWKSEHEGQAESSDVLKMQLKEWTFLENIKYVTDRKKMSVFFFFLSFEFDVAHTRSIVPSEYLDL